MACSLPPLHQIPSHDYYCIDCSKDGSTQQLLQYLDQHNEDRALYPSSRAFVFAQCQRQLQQQQQQQPAASREQPQWRVPRSELERLTEAHTSIMGTIPQGTQDDNDGTSSLGPLRLVGKPLRLYCPEGNQYHHGRIVNFRRPTHLTTDVFHAATSPVAAYEFQVSFPAGMDFRKSSALVWIVLEEHALAVGVSVIWGRPEKKTTWAPAMTWMRTSLEILPVQHQLSGALGQISYYEEEDDSAGGGPTDHPASSSSLWTLAQFWGRHPEYALLSLPDEAVDFSTAADHLFAKPPHHRSHLLAVGMAHAEASEQARIRKWHKMVLQHPRHDRALTMADERCLPPVKLKESREENVEEILLPKPCQLIPKGLDRLYLMDMLEKVHPTVDRSQDVAASLTCQRVESTAAAMEQLAQDRRLLSS